MDSIQCKYSHKQQLLQYAKGKIYDSSVQMSYVMYLRKKCNKTISKNQVISMTKVAMVVLYPHSVASNNVQETESSMYLEITFFYIRQ